MNLEDWRKAGKIGRQALLYGSTLIKPGVKYSDVSDAVEKKIYDLGGDLGFPVNISINETAAHNVAMANDDRTFTTDDIVKLDVGVHINGAIADNALTKDLTGKYEKLLRASLEARDEAIKILKPGLKIREIGKKVETIIKKYGYKPVKNLSGHSIKEYTVHAGLTIPNYDDGNEQTLKEGTVIAIEPFATDGEGMIYEGHDAQIFRFVQKRPVRSLITREAIKALEERKGLPTSIRWLAKKLGSALKANMAMKEMNQLDMIYLYPALIEVKKGMVAQFENTILITKDGYEVLTQ
jgi:methionyl aminopeptidase